MLAFAYHPLKAKQVEGIDVLLKKLHSTELSDSLFIIVNEISYQIKDFDNKSKEMILRKVLRLCNKKDEKDGVYYTNLIFAKFFVANENWAHVDKYLKSAIENTSNDVISLNVED